MNRFSAGVVTAALLILGCWPRSVFSERVIMEGKPSTLNSMFVSSTTAQVGIATAAVTAGVALEVGGNLQVNGNITGSLTVTSVSTLTVTGYLNISGPSAGGDFMMFVTSADPVTVATVTIAIPARFSSSQSCHLDIVAVDTSAAGIWYFYFDDAPHAKYGVQGSQISNAAQVFPNRASFVGLNGEITADVGNTVAANTRLTAGLDWHVATAAATGSPSIDAFSIAVTSIDSVGNVMFSRIGTVYNGSSPSSISIYVSGSNNITAATRKNGISGHFELWCKGFQHQ